MKEVSGCKASTSNADEAVRPAHDGQAGPVKRLTTSVHNMTHEHSNDQSCNRKRKGDDGEELRSSVKVRSSRHGLVTYLVFWEWVLGLEEVSSKQAGQTISFFFFRFFAFSLFRFSSFPFCLFPVRVRAW